MKRVEHLIGRARFFANNIETTRYNDIRLAEFLSDAQREIQNVIFQKDTNSKYFSKDGFLSTVTDQESYSLPTDVFADSAISAVGVSYGSSPNTGKDAYHQLDKISEKERRIRPGYIIHQSSLLLSPVPTQSISNGVMLSYIYKIPTLSIRIGQITDKSDTTITMGTLYTSEDISDYDDYVTVVGGDEAEVLSGIKITGYNTGTGVITTDSDISSVSVGEYVLLGAKAIGISELPDVCEKILIDLTKRIMESVDSSSDFQVQDLMTERELSLIASLFADSDPDAPRPPVTDLDWF